VRQRDEDKSKHISEKCLELNAECTSLAIYFADIQSRRELGFDGFDVNEILRILDEKLNILVKGVEDLESQLVLEILNTQELEADSDGR